MGEVPHVGFRGSVFGLCVTVFGFEERRPRNKPEAVTKPDAVRWLRKFWMGEIVGMNVRVVRDEGSGADSLVGARSLQNLHGTATWRFGHIFRVG